MRKLLPSWFSPVRDAFPIGIDFGYERLHLAQCETHGDRIRVRAAASLLYPQDWATVRADRKKLRRFIHHALSMAPFSGKRVCSLMPPSQVRIVPLSFRMPAGANEAMMVWRALQERLRSDLSDDIADYLTVHGLETEESETNVLAAVARRTDVMAHLRFLEDAGLEPAALDVGPAALARLLAAAQLGDNQHSVLLINFGVRRSYITIVLGGKLVLDREVDFGESGLVSKLATALQIENAMGADLLRKHGFFPSSGSSEADHLARALHEILHPEFAVLAEEVSRTLIYIASKTRGRMAQRVYLHGSLAAYPGLVQRMQHLVEVPVEVLDPFSMLPGGISGSTDAIKESTNSIALAMGLALRN